MKIFDQAVLRLTTIYTAFILALCISFSIVIYTITCNEMDREMPSVRIPTGIVIDGRLKEFEELIRQRNAEVQAALLAQLFIINVLIVSTGAVASYFLARYMLQPVHEAYENQTRFISDASHELRTPLTAITMENEVILRDKSATKIDYQKQITSNLEEVGKLQRLTNYLLQLGRRDQIKLTSLELSDTVNTIIKKYAPIAEKKHIELSARVTPRQISANPEALATVIGTIVENAIKYSPEQSKVTIKLAGDRLSISDQGPGIPSDDLPYIFDRFYRAEKSRTTDGYGLGLALAKQLAEQMNMKIAAQNNKYKGATFLIIFSKSSARVTKLESK